MKDWSEHNEFFVSLKYICTAYNQRHGTHLEPKSLSNSILHKLFQIDRIMQDQINTQQEALKILENQYRLFLSRLLEDANKLRISQDRLSLEALEQQLGSQLRDVYLMSEFLGFAFKDAQKLIEQYFPAGHRRPELGLQAFLKSNKKLR